MGWCSLEDVKVAEINDSVTGMLKKILEIGQHAIEHQEQEQEPNLGDVNTGALSWSTVQCVDGDRAGIRHTQADQADLKTMRISGEANVSIVHGICVTLATFQRDTSFTETARSKFEHSMKQKVCRHILSNVVASGEV